MSEVTDFELLSRLEALEVAVASGAAAINSPASVLVGRTVSGGSYPTAATAFYRVQALTVDGTEVEGGSVSFADDGPVFLAANLGASVPSVGTKVILFGASGRWVFRF